MIPPLPPDQSAVFRATVHGTVFGERARLVGELSPGEALVLIPDPPDEEDPAVWVHRTGGDTLGHLPPEIAVWLAPWLLQGGSAAARVLKVAGPEEPSWRRLTVEVNCSA